MTRLFVAVWPPDDVIEDLRALPRKDQRGVRFVDPERWHVTLRFLGDADPDEVAAALDGLHAEPATARLGPGVDVFGERIVMVPVHGLDDLAAAVTACTADLGEPPRARFVGHLTLARVKPHATMPRALGMMIDGEFAVDEVALVASRLHRDGARYDTIGTWALG